MADTQVQLAICREISGFGDVSERFARSAFARIEERYGAEAVEAMIALHRQGGGAALFAADAGPSGVLARELLGHLYTGAPKDMPDVVAEDYFESLIWRAALAHPPALSGGYFGHWRYPPEDLHDA